MHGFYHAVFTGHCGKKIHTWMIPHSEPLFEHAMWNRRPCFFMLGTPMFARMPFLHWIQSRCFKPRQINRTMSQATTINEVFSSFRDNMNDEQQTRDVSYPWSCQILFFCMGIETGSSPMPATRLFIWQPFWFQFHFHIVLTGDYSVLYDSSCMCHQKPLVMCTMISSHRSVATNIPAKLLLHC